MRNVSDRHCIEKTQFVFDNFFFLNHAIYEIMWEKYGSGRQATDENIMWCMHFA